MSDYDTVTVCIDDSVFKLSRRNGRGTSLEIYQADENDKVQRVSISSVDSVLQWLLREALPDSVRQKLWDSKLCNLKTTPLYDGEVSAWL